MSIIKQNGDGHGSLKDIQLLVNNRPHLLDSLIKKNFKELSKEDFSWKSPLAVEDYAEYRDDDFIAVLGLDVKQICLGNFWPKRGPQWDALGTASNNAVFLVEAKANIPELVSPSSQAGVKSKVIIEKALEEAKTYLGLQNEIAWSGKFYQYTNRIAHLYFLRKKGVDAYLINIYFVGDKSVNGPETVDEWKAALQVMYTYLGLKRHKLNKYMADIFINYVELRDPVIGEPIYFIQPQKQG